MVSRNARYYRATGGLDLLHPPIPVNAEVRRAELTERLVQFTSQLTAWQELNGEWGHINNLIKATNETYERLGLSERIPEGLY